VGLTVRRKPSSSTDTVPAWWLTTVVMIVGCAMTASVTSAWLSNRAWATSFLSPTSWATLARSLSTGQGTAGGDDVHVAFVPLFGVAVAVTAVTWCGGAAAISRRQRIPLGNALRRWGYSGWLWWCGLGLWEWAWIAAAATGWDSLADLLVGSIPFWAAACLSGWLTTGHVMGASGDRRSAFGEADSANAERRIPNTALWSLAASYTLVFVTMNWRLWSNLYIPHGDSAMYEEHLWNLLHGKGFRSYLDQGLFLGEHIQVVHLALLPLYVLWPSHLLLELCESLALALGVFPVAWMTRRHTASSRAAVCAAAAYLLYFPMQFLDIEIDIKTFRPEAFGIPILLLTLDQLDRGNWRGFLIGVMGCLTVKEDYALMLGPLGVWIALSAWMEPRKESRNRKRESLAVWRYRAITIGLALTVFSVVYLWLATRVAMPWFRSGLQLHYVAYFPQFGATPEEIARTVLTNPVFVAQQFFTIRTWLNALALLLPVAGIALLSPGRLAVGLPVFGVLCMNVVIPDPRHHIHAPLVAIVFWATAAGLANLPVVFAWFRATVLGFGHSGIADSCSSNAERRSPDAEFASHALWITSLCTGLFFSLSPVGLAFWDPGSLWNWKKLYGPTARGAAFAKIAPLIPRTSKVSSTDFVHPRFTHHDRSYDYSDYVRKVGRVPDDTDFIVIDTTHRYSEMHRPEDVPEYHQADQWELVPDVTDGCFIVLNRRR
jgi:uncharacterized membrane protein